MQLLKVPGELNSLDLIAEYIVEAAYEAGLNKKAAYRLRLAVDEIVTNIITHGYQETGREGFVEMQAHLDDQHLTIYVEDDGPPFDPRTAPEPDMTIPLEDRSLGGWGVYFARHGVDSFKYDYQNNRNCNTFVVKREL